MMNRLNLKQLDAFRAVMVSGSTAEAATLLNISQPAVSRSLQNFEAAVDYELFLRRNGRLVPTPEADMLFEELDQLYHSFDHFANIMKNIRPAGYGHIRIVASTPMAQRFLPDVFAMFQQSHPNVSISLRIVVKREAKKWLDSQQFDLALLSLPIDYPAASTVHLASVYASCVVPRGHPLASKDVIHAADLADYPFISIAPDTLLRSRVDRAFQTLEVERKKMLLETQSSASICQMVGAGMGVSIVDPFNAVAFQNANIVVRPFEPRLRFDYGLAFPINRHSTQLTNNFVTLLKEQSRAFMVKNHWAVGDEES
jgi:DNA-binding transcriptional LysR family regulator